MPIMSGTVHDEYNFIAAIAEYFSGPPRHPITAAQYRNFVTTSFPPATAQRIFAEYPLAHYRTPQLAWNAVGTDSLVCPQLALNRTLASQVPVYGYEFDDTTAPFYFPRMPGFVPLAYHTSDIQYLFPLWHGGPQGQPHALNAEQEHLSDTTDRRLDQLRPHRQPQRPRRPQLARLYAEPRQTRPLPRRNPPRLDHDDGRGLRDRT